MKVYQPLTSKDLATGLYYVEWELPDGFPYPYGYATEPPSTDLLFPVYDMNTMTWSENEANLIKEMKNKLVLLDQTMTKLMEMYPNVTTIGGSVTEATGEETPAVPDADTDIPTDLSGGALPESTL